MNLREIDAYACLWVWGDKRQQKKKQQNKRFMEQIGFGVIVTNIQLSMGAYNTHNMYIKTQFIAKNM